MMRVLNQLMGVLGQTMPAEATARESGMGGGRPMSFLESLDFDALVRDNHARNWLFLMGAVFVGLLVGKVVSFSLRRLGERLERRGWKAQARVFDSGASPASLALFTLFVSVGMAQVTLSQPLGAFRTKVLLLLYTIALFWYAFNLVSIIELALIKITSKTASTLDDQLVPIIRKTLRVFLVIIGTLFVAQNVFERDIGAWLAGLGIAGLAVSLAAQDSLKHLFGSMTIFMDRPFLVGQRIIYHNFDGTVEEIGFRSTKVRLATGHLVNIPNGNIVNDPVENASARPYILRKLNLGLTYDTPAAKMEEAVGILRGLLTGPEFGPALATPGNPPRVYFDEFKADNLNIQVTYWYSPADYWAYLEHAERLNLAIMKALEGAGIELAFPTRTVYLAGDRKRELGVRVTGEATG